MSTVPGHLFVAHGDLTRLSCDGLLIPCDADRAVSRHWHRAFGWSTGAEPVDTVSPGDDIEALLAAVRRQLEVLASTVRDDPHAGRVVPLIGMPIPGTGFGTFAQRRGAVVKALVPALVTAARELGVDIALMTTDRRDYAAVQALRSSPPDLSPGKREQADALGALAGRGELSVFVGAGASIPLGLPGWAPLVNRLMQEAGLGSLPGDSDEATLKAGAEVAHKVLGDRADEIIAAALATNHCALSHALLADLRVRQTVTTNFDTALELAMAPVWGEDLRVMTRQWARSCSPWLLKLHGSVDLPGSVVLTTSQYQRHEIDGRPLYGLVQGLLMTSHLLFVGFSLSDGAYLKLAEEVDRIYRKSTGTDSPVGTALGLDSLADESKALDAAFRHIAFRSDDGDLNLAARRLEIFLDRMAWSASRTAGGAHEYLLDDHYRDLIGDDTEALHRSLAALVATAGASTSEVAGAVRAMLRQFGAENPDADLVSESDVVEGARPAPALGEAARTRQPVGGE